MQWKSQSHSYEGNREWAQGPAEAADRTVSWGPLCLSPSPFVEQHGFGSGHQRPVLLFRVGAASVEVRVKQRLQTGLHSIFTFWFEMSLVGVCTPQVVTLLLSSDQVTFCELLIPAKKWTHRLWQVLKNFTNAVSITVPQLFAPVRPRICECRNENMCRHSQLPSLSTSQIIRI